MEVDDAWSCHKSASQLMRIALSPLVFSSVTCRVRLLSVCWGRVYPVSRCNVLHLELESIACG